MKTTVEFLNAVMEKHGLKSDNQLALFLGCTRSSISGYRHNKTFLDDPIAHRVAQLLDLDPAFVMSCTHAERERNIELKAVWQRIATLTAGLAATVLVAVILSPLFLQNGTESGVYSQPARTVYIMSNPDWVSIAVTLAVVIACFFAFPWHNPAPKKEPNSHQ